MLLRTYLHLALEKSFFQAHRFAFHIHLALIKLFCERSNPAY